MTKKTIWIIVLVVIILLAGFFYFSSKMSSPVTLKVNPPKENATLLPKDTLRGCSLTILLAENAGIYYYRDDSLGHLYKSTWNAGGIRAVIATLVKSCPAKLNVAIKATPEATYKHTVDMLDLMTIYQVPHYSVLPLTKIEKFTLKNLTNKQKPI